MKINIITKNIAKVCDMESIWIKSAFWMLQTFWMLSWKILGKILAELFKVLG